MLVVDNVVKRYGATLAVDHVSFEAQPGRLLGMLGPNGAGKTSTIRMITYITTPDEGRVLFDGEPVGPASQRRMGYLPEERGLYKKLRVGEQLEYLAALKGLSSHDARQRVRRWLERFDALSWAKKEVQELSKGMQQKVQFIATVLHEPDLLILDEPFSGLDPINSELLREVIAELRADGRVILFASHRMEQVEQLCDDICLVSEGKIVLQGTLREVKRRFGRDTVVIEHSGDGAWLDALEAEDAIKMIHRSGHRAEVRLTGATGRDVLRRALAAEADIYRYELVEPPLTEIFVEAVQGRVPTADGGRRTGDGRPSATASSEALATG